MRGLGGMAVAEVDGSSAIQQPELRRAELVCRTGGKHSVHYHRADLCAIAGKPE